MSQQQFATPITDSPCPTWHSESGGPMPKRLVPADDAMSADMAYRLASEGAALWWQGDFQNARHLLQALKRRLDKPSRKSLAKARKASTSSISPPEFPAAFHRYRLTQGQRARILGSVLIELQPDYAINLRRAPDWRAACEQAWGPPGHDATTHMVALRELLGVVGAYEWRKKGVPIPAFKMLDARAYDRIHPHYGVFSPVRGEYVDLIARASLPDCVRHGALACDIGTGTGVVSAILARRGVRHIVATDLSARALACAQENLQRLGIAAQVQLMHCDLFPPQRAALIVCNPPWVPARAVTTLEQAVYDEESRMLRGFLQGLSAHLLPQGEGWLIVSDLAEHLRLRSRDELMSWIDMAGLQVVERLDAHPQHGKVNNAADPLHAARRLEVTSLWRLVCKNEQQAMN